MPKAVLDLDLAQLPHAIDGLQAYQEAFILIRLDGFPIGSATLPVVDGRLPVEGLRGRLIEAAGMPYWERSLKRYLDGPPAGKAAAPCTVAICTRDHPEDLERCLNSLMCMPDDGQEILVVDSASSSDATAQVVARCARARYVREVRPGLNVARNRALREARHDIVAFIDDDAVADPGWLRALLPNFDDPYVLCVTGLTMPLALETKAQEWSEEYAPHGRGFWRRLYTVTQWDPLDAGAAGAGANMAVRRDALRLAGPFDEALDVGTATMSGGDSEMFARILMRGYFIVYEPGALVWHSHRRTWRALRRALFGYGVGLAAFWVRCLLREQEVSAAQSYLHWLTRTMLPAIARSALRRPRATPLDLLVLNAAGFLVGPWAYFWSSAKARRMEAGAS